MGEAVNESLVLTVVGGRLSLGEHPLPRNGKPKEAFTSQCGGPLGYLVNLGLVTLVRAASSGCCAPEVIMIGCHWLWLSQLSSLCCKPFLLLHTSLGWINFPTSSKGFQEVIFGHALILFFLILKGLFGTVSISQPKRLESAADMSDRFDHQPIP